MCFIFGHVSSRPAMDAGHYDYSVELVADLLYHNYSLAELTENIFYDHIINKWI